MNGTKWLLMAIWTLLMAMMVMEDYKTLSKLFMLMSVVEMVAGVWTDE